MKDPIRVTTLTRIWKSVRRAVARNEWAVRLLGLTPQEKTPSLPGLILVQIDGLNREQLERALQAGQMPFLEQLVQKENYQVQSLYSGLPATTSAVQAELFYGRTAAVPGSGFRDHRSGQLARMYRHDVAVEVEERLQREQEGLLKGGSSFCNIFGGGAEESHFCATRLGWDDFFVNINPLRILLVILIHAGIFLRTFSLMTLELWLVLRGAVRGETMRHGLWHALKAIPARALVVVFMRELSVAGASNDAARGIPVIHLSLLGYDEQARQRGPSSRIAHWTLKGVDRSIRRLWRSAHRSAGREYDIWIFSGNGLGATEPYQSLQGETIQQALEDLVGSSDPSTLASDAQPVPQIPSRASWLGIRGLDRFLTGVPDSDTTSLTGDVQVVTAGSLAFVYLLADPRQTDRAQLAQQLVEEKGVPLVVVGEGPAAAKAFTPWGQFELPAQANDILGADHPFLQNLPTDLIALANHPDTGELLLAGWDGKSPAVSFGQQTTTNNGPAPEATAGFTLLPCDVNPTTGGREYLRLLELRESVEQFLGTHGQDRSLNWQPTHRDGDVRVLTYNIHACVGMDGELAPERIARVLSQTGADVICLQEIDVNRKRSGHRDQARQIAELLKMDFHFHPAWHIEGERFGNAIMTHLPLQLVRAGGLHQQQESRSKRGAVWAQIEIQPGTLLQVISAHLSIYPKEQLRQAQELYEEWVQPAEAHGPVVLCGDFNARPASAAYRYLAGKMLDAETATQKARHQSTYFSPRPVTRLDHIFLNSAAKPINCQVITSRLAQEASDHLPLMTDLSLPPATGLSAKDRDPE
ncbi:MAG: endonuclease/exonuclease/phosphatase family protein [Planctomycetota bacterium]|nr:endonuclease/exonuclease/phosphatase family protein [Planctomycetota bacterium]